MVFDYNNLEKNLYTVKEKVDLFWGKYCINLSVPINAEQETEFLILRPLQSTDIDTC